MKEERFRIARDKERAELRIRKLESDRRRQEKQEKVRLYEEDQERRKEASYARFAREARKKHARDSERRAIKIEDDERRHLENESVPVPKRSYLDPHVRRHALVMRHLRPVVDAAAAAAATMVASIVRVFAHFVA